MSTHASGYTRVAIWLSLGACLCMTPPAMCEQEKGPQASATQPPDRQVINLIDEDLSHFDSWLEKQGLNKDPHNTFTVKDGVLRIYGPEMGYISTKKEYGNFHLIMEFKWGQETCGEREKRARDCGVWVHGIGEHGAVSNNKRWMQAIECNIIEGCTGDILIIARGLRDRFSIAGLGRPHEERKDQFYFDMDGQEMKGCGRSNWFGKTYPWKDVKGFRGKNDIEKPIGQWNRMEYFVIGRHISIILNGVLINQVHNVRPNKGKILVQAEQADIYFRRLDLIPLAACCP
jgi:hypothetical protein